MGDNLTSELENRGAGTNHMITYWEAHADVGGPLLRDKAWFFLAYNNNLTHRPFPGSIPRSSRRRRSSATTYTKVNFALSEKDELIGYSQWGLKNRPNRGINALNSPDVRLAQDSWTWVHKAEWQRVWSDRAFSNVKAMYLRGHLADGGRRWNRVRIRRGLIWTPRAAPGAGVWPFHLRQGAAAVRRHPELLRPRRRRQPRPQVRRGLHGGLAPVLLEQRLGVPSSTGTVPA